MSSHATAAAAPPPALNGTHLQPTNWHHPGPASHDFRSDTITTPNLSMLQAITSTTLFDDVFLEDPTTTSLESTIAGLTGHAAALLVMSGTMGNQVALRTLLTQPPHAVLCDARAHILNYEAGGAATLSQAMVVGVAPRNGRYLTLEDVVGKAVLSDDIHACPTRVVALENTLGGVIMPLAEVRRIGKWAREHGVKMHLDGARLWNAAAAGAGSVAEYCREFDSVSLCFSKGLGAPIGSVVVGDEGFVKRARWVRKSIGGGIRQSGILAAAARVAVEEVFGAGGVGDGGLLQATHEIARRVGRLWEGLGGRVELPIETSMVWLDLKGAGVKAERFVEVAREEGVKVLGGRIVVHYQICEQAVEALGRAMKRVVEEARDGKGGNVEEKEYRYGQM